MKENRYHLLDSLRGLLLINMVAFHAIYDIVYILGIPIPWYTGLPGYFWQQSICWGFIFLSGFCFRLSRHPLRHGLVVLGAGLFVSLVTCIVMPSQAILYGVLWLLGLAGLVQCLVWAVWNKLGYPPFPAVWGLILSLLAFFLTRNVPYGWLGFQGIQIAPLPPALYSGQWLALLGFPGPGFYSADYFPLVPWFFLYLAGYFLWRCIGSRRRIMDKLRPGIRPLAFLGRHSLLIYLLHQPVLMGVFTLLGMS